MTPTKYGIALTVPLNQGAALLHVYTDGSVLLSHGGMEMGQGLHTKMVQVCSHLLVIPPERIHIVDTVSGVVANASPTAASHSTDLYGMAVKVRKIWPLQLLFCFCWVIVQSKYTNYVQYSKVH